MASRGLAERWVRSKRAGGVTGSQSHNVAACAIRQALSHGISRPPAGTPGCSAARLAALPTAQSLLPLHLRLLLLTEVAPAQLHALRLAEAACSRPS